MRRFFVASAALLVLLSCQQPLGVGDDLGPSFAISDAAHSGTVEHFYFLPPMVPDPAVDGVFDATRSPVVEICLFDVTANTCAATQPSNYPIVFTMDSGPGSEAIRLVPEDEHYIVNWHTDEFGLDPESTYRIFVKEPGPLGYADVDVVGNGGEMKNVNTQEFIPLVNGRTLPIKFRIEEGLAFAVDGSGGEITAAGGQVTLDVPAGAVTTEPGEDPVPVTVDPVPTNDPSLPVGAGGLAGSIYDMGPDGLQFEEPVELTFSYDPVALTAANPNAREQDLALFVLENGVWVPLDGVTVDTGTKKVSGFTTHFSTFGILTLTRACPGGAPVSFETVQEAYDATMPGGAVELCDGTHNPVEGVVLDAPVTIRAELLATPVVPTSVELASFWVDGYATGTVVIDGLTFDFQTPDGPDIDNRSYAIKAQGTYDQLIVRNSSFDIDAGSRGSVFSRPSTVAGAATMVENVTIVGGAYGVSAQSTHVDVLGSDFDGLALNATIHFGLASPASGRVEGSTFGQCGTGRCIYVISGASVDVVSNTFAAPVLTGDGGPDQNQIIFFGGAASGLIDQNVFAGCGYWTCVDITSGATVTVTANEFNHVPGQSALEWDYASIFDLRFGADVTLDGNTLNSCGVICYKILDGATATIRNEVVNTPVDHGTLDIVIAAEDDPASGPNTIVFEDNTVTGSGGQKAIGLFTETGATANRNTFAGLLNGFELHAGSTLTGQDNVFGLSDTAVRVFDGSATFRFNDFTGQATDIGGGGEGASSDLTCNYWGNAAGPQNVIGGVPGTVYTPWAVAPVAGTGAGGCSGS